MKNRKNCGLVLGFIAVFLLFNPAQTKGESTEWLKGKVHFIDKPDLSLEQKIELAQREFKKTKDGDYFITGYAFRCWHGIDIDGCSSSYTSSDTFRVKHDDGEIVISSGFHKGRSFRDEEDVKEDIGVLFLSKISGRTRTITDFDIIDLDNTYRFEEHPVYWLGKSGTNESMQFLENTFDSGDYGNQKELVFIISLHDNPKTYDFLKRVAVGKYGTRVRKNAVFWLGNYKDEMSLKYLKDIKRSAKSTELKKHIVFALSLSDMREAVLEMIKIAKTDSSRAVRKNAIFWLGQKASKEAVDALRDVVEKSDDVEMKKQAVFAISQLKHKGAVPLLIEIARINKSPEVRKNAIFWLGQTGDERAVKFFEKILLKK